jgi:hypothetical protein
MVISIGNIWIVQVRVPVHVQDMAPSSHTVWSIFKKENGAYTYMMTAIALLIVQ